MKSLASVGVAALLIVSFARAGDPTIQATAPAKTPQSDVPDRRPERPIAERSAQIRAEFETERAASRQAATKAENPRAKGAVAPKRPIERAADFARQMVELAESSPRDPAARDALIRVIESRGRDAGTYGDQFARAAALLVRHHGDDAEAVRIGLGLDNVVTPRRDALLLGFYAAAKGREATGLARLALAEYLAKKARIVASARSARGRPKRRVLSRGSIREFDLTDEEYADHLELRQCDPQALQAEAERLFEEVISEYGDVPHVTRRSREMEALLRAPTPGPDEKPLTASERRSIEERLAHSKKTLGQEAEARVDDMLNLAVGKPAPEIEGVDVDGKPLRLSDYRGKVVMLVFWGSWCGPCMAQVPHERDLAERLKGQPFALLGVDCEENKDAARGVMARERMTWPSWFDGAAGTGPIARRYHVRAYPTVFVLDARGVIRVRSLSSVGLDDTVDKLLAEMKRPALGQGTSRPESEKNVTPRP